MERIRWWEVVVGSILILIGVLFLLDTLGLLGFDRVISILWPLILVAIGLLLIFRRTRGGRVADNPSQTVVGEVKLGNLEWDLHDTDTGVLIGQLHMDLRRAHIPNGETRLRVKSGIGSIRIVVPPDIGISARGEVGAGSINVLGQKTEGLGRQLSFASPGYHSAEKRLNADLSLFMGEISIVSS